MPWDCLIRSRGNGLRLVGASQSGSSTVCCLAEVGRSPPGETLSSASKREQPQKLGTQASHPISTSPSVLHGDSVADPHDSGSKPCGPLAFASPRIRHHRARWSEFLLLVGRAIVQGCCKFPTPSQKSDMSSQERGRSAVSASLIWIGDCIPSMALRWMRKYVRCRDTAAALPSG